MKRKRGRPRKDKSVETPLAIKSSKKSVKATASKSNRKSSKPKKRMKKARKDIRLDDPVSIWNAANKLTKNISSHYSMREGERMLAFAYALTLPKKAVMVEIGVTHGKTGALLAYIAKLLNFSYYGIDNFTVEGNAEEVRATLDNLDLPYTLLVGDSASVPFKKKIDFLLIDGGHDLFNIKADCERWLPLLKPGGLVIFHEFSKEIERGHPHWYVYHFAQLYTKDWIEEDFIPNILIRRKPID